MAGSRSGRPAEPKLALLLPRETSVSHAEFTLRLISALTLAVIAIAVTWTGRWPFLLFVSLCIVVLSWEWTHMGRLRGAAEMATIMIFAVAAATGVAAGQAVAAGAVLAVAVLACLLLGRTHAALGLAYVGVPAMAVMALRADADYGLLAMIFLLLSVWCTDVMAYAVGRLVGGPRLAPSISPGKTWSGCVGGLVFPAALGYGFALWMGGTSPAALALVSGFLSIATQAGDLAESAMKRNAGVKDAGKLIPGHGGMLDRLDGFLVASAFAGLLALLRDPSSPGRALLIWQ